MNLRIIFGQIFGQQSLAVQGRALTVLAVLLAGLTFGAPMAHAQIMKPGGVPIPSFFFSAGERRAREACANQEPACRASVRAQMEYEMAISLTIPWIILGAGIVGALLYLRAQEKKKLRARAMARAHHDPGSFKKLDRERTQREANNEDEEERDDL